MYSFIASLNLVFQPVIVTSALELALAVRVACNCELVCNDCGQCLAIRALGVCKELAAGSRMGIRPVSNFQVMRYHSG